MSMPRWRLAGLLGALLVLLAGLPVEAVAELRPADAAAPGGRLVVFWRNHAPSQVGVAGVAAMRTSADARRTVVVAESGKIAAVAASLHSDPRVRTVVPDATIKELNWPADGAPTDLLYPNQPDLAQIHVPDAWKTTTGDPSVVVAFIDTGVDLGHPDIAGVNVVAPRNETFNSTDVNDTEGHGTHTSGTVFARANNEIGIAGIAPDASLMPIKILDGNGSGFFSDLLDGVDWARTHGAKIVSMSVGSWLSSDQVAAFQPTFTAARAAGLLLVAAAGNSSSITKSYPANLGGVVSVAAVDGDNLRASFSTYNSGVDITAPGVDLLSTGIGDPSGYERMSGTSMSTPHVAGVAALVWSARPGLTVDQLEAVLRGSATDLGAAGRDDLYGDGLVNAQAALTSAVPSPLPNLEPPAPPTGAFSMTFAAPAAAVRQDGTSYTIQITLNHEASDALLTRSEWRITGGRCPAEDARSVEDVDEPFSVTLTETDLHPGSCYRWYAAAIDDNDEIVRATSDPVTIRDRIAPTITGRTPAAGARGVTPAAHVTIRFSEPVTGISGATLRIRDLATGRWIRASVQVSAAGTSAVVVPKLRMYRATRYEVVVLRGIRDGSLNRLAPAHWVFTTRR
jgi:hypothetical protein